MKKTFIKLLSLFLLASFALSIVSCGSKTKSSSEQSVINESSEDSVSSVDDTNNTDPEYDLVVYGDTAAAVVAAVAASRQKIDVALVAPNKQLGGMISGGLSQTDLGDSSVIGGMAREFFKRNAIKKGSPAEIDWYFEPHVAEEIFADMLIETKSSGNGVAVFLGERLVENNGVVKSGATITKIICESGKTFEARQFIDASYEGDLMAQAGVSYTYGREGRDVYGESLAGVVSPGTEGANNHNFNFLISAYDEQGNLKYKEVSTEPLAEIGSGDKKIQAYNFRLVLTNNPNNMLPFPMPEGYDRTRYALLADYLKEWEKTYGKAPTAHDLFGFYDGLNKAKDKWDFNNKGAFSTDYIGGNYGYPDATYAEREQIWQEHYKYVAGLLYFLANDPDVPEETRLDISSYGLPKDEYKETGNWTFQLYIREGRRMLGEYVMTQKDIEKGGGLNLFKDDTIGMGSYNSDSHHVQRYITQDGYIRNEGNMEVRVDPYEIPYRVLLPKSEEADNLLVTCTVSASHVAYSTIRMEPQYMIMGEAAGTAAAIAVNDASKIHDVDILKLQNILKKGGAVLSKTEKPKNQIDIIETDVLFFDSFAESFDDGWKKTPDSNSTILSKKQTITNEEAFVKLNKRNSQSYAYYVPKIFTAPTGDFTLTSRMKIEPYNQRFDLTIRDQAYLVRLVIISDGKTATLQDRYANTDKTFSVSVDVWHDLKIVVDSHNAYSYDLYIDGVLAWENASYTWGFGSDILKIGGAEKSEAGRNTVMNLCLDYVKIENSDEPDRLRAIGNIFKDSAGNKIKKIVSENEINCDIYLQNTTDSDQNIKIVAELYQNGTLQTNNTAFNCVTIENGTIGNGSINIKIPENKKGLTVKVKVLYGNEYEKILIDNITL